MSGVKVWVCVPAKGEAGLVDKLAASADLGDHAQLQVATPSPGFRALGEGLAGRGATSDVPESQLLEPGCGYGQGGRGGQHPAKGVAPALVHCLRSTAKCWLV